MPAPFLCHVEVENFRNLADFKVDLRESSVVVGENSSGKSNLLHALRLVLDPSLSDSDRILRAEDFWDGLDAPFDGNAIRVCVDIGGFSSDKNTKAVLADCIVTKTPLTARLTYEFRPRKTAKGDQLGESAYEFVVFGGADEKNRVGADVRRWLSLVLLPALRDSAGEMRNWRRSPLTPLLERARRSITEDGADAVREKLNEATQILLDQEPVRKLERDINARIANMLGPIHSVATALAFIGTEAEQLFRSLRLYLDGVKTRPVDDASLGTANVLFLSMLLQDLDERRAADELAGSVLAIEEPEAHLHPHLQRLLFRHFLRRGHAVLVTTHSPHLASVAPLPSIVLLRGTDKGTKPCTIAGLDLAEQQIADLERYLDVTRAEMLFAKAVMFVEGPAEEYVLSAFAGHHLRSKKIADSLDELGISICSVDGTDFDPYVCVASEQGWSIPNVVVTDGDHQLKKKGRQRYAGCLRGIRLLEEGEEARLAQLLDEGEHATVEAELERYGVYVGNDTLEVDLVASLANEMMETFSELSRSPTARKAFGIAVQALLKTPGDREARGVLLKRIERLGKGRFAQRLAGKIGGEHKPPKYIQRAIDRIVRDAKGSDAGSFK